MGKTLVLYYSFEGNTRKIAEVIASSLGADIEEIKPVKELSSKGFSKYFWGGSQVFMGKKPEIITPSVDFNQYDKIFLGSPIWAGTFAPPIKTLLEGDYLKDKKIAYFYTHDGGHKKAAEKGKESISIKNEFLGVMDFMNVKDNFDAHKAKVQEWTKSI